MDEENVSVRFAQADDLAFAGRDGTIGEGVVRRKIELLDAPFDPAG